MRNNLATHQAMLLGATPTRQACANAPVATSLYAGLAEIVVPQASGATEARAEALVVAMKQLAASAEIGHKLPRVAINPSKLDQLADDAMHPAAEQSYTQRQPRGRKGNLYAYAASTTPRGQVGQSAVSAGVTLELALCPT